MKLSVQLYTVRDQYAADPRDTYARLSDMGLEYVEGGGSFGAVTAEEGRTMLEEYGLKASGTHYGISELEADPQKAITDAKTLGLSYIIVPWIGKDVWGDGWDVAAKRLEKIGKIVKDAGLTLCYHNHDFEFKNEGTPGLDQLYAAADPGLLKAELDIAWTQIGGGVPAEYIKKLSNRLPLVHLKDFNPNETPIWRPCGQGLVDWDAALAACNDAGVEFGAIELDESPGDPFDAVRESVEFLRAKGVE